MVAPCLHGSDLVCLRVRTAKHRYRPLLDLRTGGAGRHDTPGVTPAATGADMTAGDISYAGANHAHYPSQAGQDGRPRRPAFLAPLGLDVSASPSLTRPSRAVSF